VRALYDPVLRDGVSDTTTIFAYMGRLVLSYNEKAGKRKPWLPAFRLSFSG